MRVRRSRFVFFYRDDQPFLDIGSMLRGEMRSTTLPRLYAISIVSGRELEITEETLKKLLTLPEQEIEALEDDLRELAEAAFVVTDSDEPALADVRRREELLSSSGWNLYSALFHFLTRWSGVDIRGAEPEIRALTEEELRQAVEVHGLPPPAFPPPNDSGAVHLLPLQRRGALYDLLSKRRTTRNFDRTTPLALDAFAQVLDLVFGCHGYARAIEGVETLKRTSPSGGGLHPVEAYPLVAQVEGLDPGLYHYRASDHVLELREPLDAVAATMLATAFVSGQWYFGNAQVVFLLTARFERNHWKYRRHPKAYPAMLMDAAHLSQTLYLVAADLGLGAFVTAAINGADIDERLGLDGVTEGAVAVCGCGVPAAEPSEFDPAFVPYTPGETTL